MTGASAAADPPVIVGALAPPPPLEPPPGRILVLVDDGVPRERDAAILAALSPLSAGEPPRLLRLAGGEARKSIEGWREILESCAAAGLDRDSLLVAAGGGALGDAAGFAAATWHRGIRWLAVPTTLVAMVDAHLGGKTALDLGGVKNPIGAFWWPVAVLADPIFLASLPPREVRSGWGELVKSALIGDAPLFAALEEEARDAARGGAGAPPRLPSAEEIGRAIAVKRRIVAEDPRESDRRRVLNLGHTLGHALETLPGSGLAHGEAVAAGVVFAAELAADLGRAPRTLAGRIAAVLARHGLPTSWPTERLEELLRRIAADKKRRRGESWFALPAAPGAVELAPVPAERIARRLERGEEDATRARALRR